MPEIDFRSVFLSIESLSVLIGLIPLKNSANISPATYKRGVTIIATAHAAKESERKPESKRRIKENTIQTDAMVMISAIRSTVLLKILNHFGCSPIMDKMTSQYFSRALK